MTTCKRLAAVLPFLLLGISARAQDRSLHWDELAVEARLDAAGTLHVRERQTLVFTGDWNGGERQFNLRLGERLKLVKLSRIDPATGREIPLVQDDQITQVDQYDWMDNSTLRWRSRLPSDPPFEGTAITYVLDYTLSNVLQERGGVYHFFHNFVFPERAGVIERFVLDLELAPEWLSLGALPSHLERKDLPPDESVELEARLEHHGLGRPAASRATPAPLRYAAFAAALAAMGLLYVRFRRHEESLGRFTPAEAPAEWDEAWLQENLFRYRPEEAGALWDQRVGPPEVAAMLARLVEEGKLESEVRSEGFLFFKKDVLHLRLLVDRNGLLDYERRLIDKLFFGGRTETSTAEVRDHYRSSGFNPSSLIEGDLRRRLENLPPMRGRKGPGPGLRRSLCLLLATLALFGLGAITQWENALVTAAIAAFACTWMYVPGLLAAFAWRKRTENLDLASLTFLVPGLMAFALCALIAFFDDWLAPWRLFVRPGLFSVMGLALLPVTVWSSLLNNARTREKPEAIAFRKRLGAARGMLRRELASASPRLRDEWLPYLLAFGLQSDMDRWFRAFGGSRGDRGIVTSTSSWSGSSGGGGWTGGGGSFGGAGSTASWAAAATGMAAGVSAASSSGGGGGGGGGSSGGGGGGGW